MRFELNFQECSCGKNSVIKVLAPTRDIALHDNRWLGARVTVTDPESPLCGQEGIIKHVIKNSSRGLTMIVIGHEEDLFLPLTEHVIDVHYLFLQKYAYHCIICLGSDQPYSSETHLTFEHYGLQAGQSHSDNTPPLHGASGKAPWIGIQVAVCGQHHPL